MSFNVQKYLLQSDKILTSLSPVERLMFYGKAQTLNFKSGQLIFYQEGIPTGIYFLVSGKTKLFKTGYQAKDQIFYIYKAGDLFGYHPLLCNTPYEDSCECIENCEVLFIGRAKFSRLLETIPKLKTLILQNTSHEFGVLANIITILAQNSVRSRLAFFLLVLHERYADQKSIINIKREDLANLVGTARESLGRILYDFKDEKLISVNKRSIEIINYAGIVKVINS